MSLALIAEKINTLADSASPSDVFRRLLDASRVSARKSAIFLVRQGRVKGWGCLGYEPGMSARLREWSEAADAGWLGSALAGDERIITRGHGDAAPDFGQPLSDEVIALPVRVAGRPVAVILAERSGDAQPWDPAGLEAVVRVAELKLDLDLLRRKLKPAEGAPKSAPAESAEASAAEPAEATQRSAGTNPGVQLEPAEQTAAPQPAPGPSVDENDPDQIAAQRYARLIATDIRLYNEESVMLGRQHGDLANRLGEHLNRGRETFMRRYSHLGPHGLEILQAAFIQVLANGNQELLPPPAK